MVAETETMAVAEVVNTLSAGERRHLGALERVVKQGLTVFREVGLALLEIRDSRLYRDTHTSFENYVEDRWQLEVNRAYQFIGAAEVVKVLGDKNGPTNEAQARELVPLLHEDPKAVKKVWSKVLATNEPVTATLIRRVRGEVMNTNGSGTVIEKTLTDRLVEDVTRLISAYQRWDQSKPGRRERNLVGAVFRKLNEVVKT